MEKTGEKRARKQRGGRPKKRARGVEQFLDIEAEHDDEDDDFEEEGDAEEVRDFILEETDVDAAQNMMQARRLMAQSDAFGDADEQESMKRLASELEQRYRRQQPQQQRRQPQAEAPGQTAPPQQSVPAPVQKKAQYVQDELDVKLESAMQQSLLPSIQDPRLFAVRCRIGLERDAVVDLLTRYYLTKHSRQKRMLIKTAFAPLEGVGYIYVEAYKLDHVRLAIKDVRALRTDQIRMVKLEEMPSVFNIKGPSTTLERGSWVRVRRGLYKGDLAHVLQLKDNDTRVLLKLRPRIDYDVLVEQARSIHKKGFKRRWNRPVPRLFDVAVALQKGALVDDMSLTSRFAVCNNNKYFDGFLIRSMPIDQVQLEEAPPLDEVERFTERAVYRGAADREEPLDEDARAMDLKVELDKIKTTLRKKRSFVRNESVRVVQGDLKGLTGIVLSASADSVTVRPTVRALQHEVIECSPMELEKHFSKGSHVKVVSGPHVGHTGLITDVSGDQVSIFSDVGGNEVTVHVADVVQSQEVTAGRDAAGKFQIHDFVSVGDANTAGVIVQILPGKDNDVAKQEFSVLDSSGAVRSVLGSELRKLMNKKFDSAGDSRGRTLRVGNRIDVREGPHAGLSGSIRFIFRGVLFAHDSKFRENAGVFVVRANQTVKSGVAADEKQGLGTTLSGFNKEAQQSKASETTRRDMPGARTNKFMRHRTVRITRGPHKGALATVISTDDTRFLLSLNTTGRLVHVQLADAAPLQSDKTRATLSNFRDLARMPAGGQRMDAAAVGGRTGAYSGGRTGAFQGGRTGAYTGGGRTGAYVGGRTGAYGGHTPSTGTYGGTTPHLGGSLTGQYMGGSQTGQYQGGRTGQYQGQGGRTGQYQQGGRTGQYQGGRTGQYQGGRTGQYQGGRTGQYQGQGGQTGQYAQGQGGNTGAYGGGTGRYVGGLGSMAPKQ